MIETIRLLQDDRILHKLYEYSTNDVRIQFSLSQIEVDIIDFLARNPEKDCASDIVSFRGLQKGNVSAAITSLHKKHYLRLVPDRKDRRKTHLFLTLPAETISYEIAACHQVFYDRIFSGLPQESRDVYESVTAHILENAHIEWEFVKKKRNDLNLKKI